MSLFYKILYAVGVTPWEHMPASPAARQVSAMLDDEERGDQPPYGSALDLGCGTGIWSVRLAERGWDVTGVEIVPKAVRRAKARARASGVDGRFLEGSVTALRDAGVNAGFRLVLDFGTVHGLAPADVKQVAQEVTAVTADDATLLMYASSPGRRGPLPRGLSRVEVEDAAPWRWARVRSTAPSALSLYPTLRLGDEALSEGCSGLVWRSCSWSRWSVPPAKKKPPDVAPDANWLPSTV